MRRSVHAALGFAVLAVAGLAAPAGAYVTKGGQVYDETWGPGTVFVESTVVVGTWISTLTILPETVVKFAPGTTIRTGYGGAINASATEAQPIVFTSMNDDSVGELVPGSTGSPARGDWGSLYWRGSSTFRWCTVRFGTSINHHGDGDNRFSYCEVSEMSGDGITNVYMGAPIVEHCKIHDCGGSAVLYYGVARDNEVWDCGWGINGRGDYHHGVSERNTVRRCGNGLGFWYAWDVNHPSVIQDNVVSDCTHYGIGYDTNYCYGYDTTIFVRRNRISRCGAGIAATYIGNRSNVVEDNTVSDCGGVGITGTVVLHNRIENCRGPGIQSQWDGGANEIVGNVVQGCNSGLQCYWGGSADPTRPAVVENNLVVDNRGPGMILGAYGVSQFWLVRGNTVANNSGIGVALHNAAANQLYANLIAFSGAAGIFIGPGLQGDHNLAFGNAGGNFVGGYTPGSHDVVADPQFAGAGSGDYHLRWTSPAIDGGGPEGPSEDLEGDHRPQGLAYDIGCYEDEGSPPNRPPIADAGPDRTVEVGPVALTVTLDGSGSSDPDGDVLEYTWVEGGSVIAGPSTAPQAQVRLDPGHHQLTLTVDDRKGGTASDGVALVLVSCGPSTTLNLAGPPGEDDWFVGDVTVTVSATDPPDVGFSGVASIHYTLDGGSEQIASVSGQPKTASTSFVVADEGVHTLTAWAVDAAGNRGPDATAQPRIDRSPPSTTIDPGSGYDVALGSDPDAIVIWYRVNGGDWQQTTPGSIILPGDGDYEIEAYSIDAAGNRGTTVIVAFQIDKTAPVTTITPTRAPDEGGTYTDPVDILIAATDNVSGVAWTKYSLDGGATWQPYVDAITLDETGTFSVEAYSRDVAGNKESPPAKTVFVLDLNEPPVADAGDDQTVEANAVGGADVTLDGSGSSDPDGDALTYRWTWTDADGDEQTATGVSPTVFLPLGATTVTLVVNDGQVDSAPDEVVVTVRDTTPPSIVDLRASPNTLWPPNGKLRNVTLAYALSDIADDTLSAEIAEVQCNEASFDPSDWVPIDTTHLKLRAEREGGNRSGRIYTILVTCSDAAGNTATGEVTVTVPHDQRLAAAGGGVAGLLAVPTALGAQVTFALSAESEVTATVLNLAGRPVRTLCQAKRLTPGTNTLVWNAQSDAGLPAPNGTYLVEVVVRGPGGAQSRALAAVRVGR